MYRYNIFNSMVNDMALDVEQTPQYINAEQLCLNVYNFTSLDSHGMSAAQSEEH